MLYLLFSGGSITAAYYAHNKENYEDFERGFVINLSKGVLWPSFLYLGIAGFLLLSTSVVLSYITALLMCMLFPNQSMLSGICATLVGGIIFFLLLVLCLKYSFITIPTSKLISRYYIIRYSLKERL